MLIAIASIAVTAWLYLLTLRGGFWLTRERLDQTPGDPFGAGGTWPDVTAVIPARNEADVITPVVAAMLAMDYPGRLRVVLVDDASSDGTGAVARAAGAGDARLEVIEAAPLPDGWTGKLWAMSCGVAYGDEQQAGATEYYFFTDADIVHAPDTLRRLVAKAHEEGLDLVSQMVTLAVKGIWESLLIPAFVFFFAKLYPFAWVNQAALSLAAAAGGCMLVRRTALESAGGLGQIRDHIIDDCGLAGLLKEGGPKEAGAIWLGLTKKSHSIRGYEGFGGVWHMVARTAYTQLGYSPLLLAGTVFAMAMIYLAGPLLVVTYPLHGNMAAALLGGLAYGLCALSIVPMLHFYRQFWVLALALPLIGLLYTMMTVASAIAYYRGRGGAWKGRFGAAAHNARHMEPGP